MAGARHPNRADKGEFAMAGSGACEEPGQRNFFLGSKRGVHPPAAGGLGGYMKQREVAFESELPSGEMRNEWNRPEVREQTTPGAAA